MSFGSSANAGAGQSKIATRAAKNVMALIPKGQEATLGLQDQCQPYKLSD